MVFGDTSEDVDDKVISPRFLFLSIPQTSDLKTKSFSNNFKKIIMAKQVKQKNGKITLGPAPVYCLNKKS